MEAAGELPLFLATLGNLQLPFFHFLLQVLDVDLQRREGEEGGREGGRVGGGREVGRERGREGRREGGKEGRGGREGREWGEGE